MVKMPQPIITICNIIICFNLALKASAFRELSFSSYDSFNSLIPSLPTIPNLPDIPSIPNIPDIPSIPNIPKVRNMFSKWLPEVIYTDTDMSRTPNKSTAQPKPSRGVINRSFTIDHVNNQFLMDGKPFQYVAGSFHYFRALPQTWRKKFRTFKASGLNTIDTYIEWSTHNPEDGVYHWHGIANLERFIRLASEEGFYVILRPGPYICAERDMGGFPYWLLTKYPDIKLRTSDPNYLKEVRIWYEQLMPRIQPFLYGNGGSVIMVQVENEYGTNPVCDKEYQIWLRNETDKYVQGKSVLFTNDHPEDLGCGKIENVFATIDIPPTSNLSANWEQLRKYQSTGPLVVSEFYCGWLTYWQNQYMTVDVKSIVKSLDSILQVNASISFYVFFGGTNFGFTSGAQRLKIGIYSPEITSYDYDAPMTEAGDPTPKFRAIREVLAKYFPMPNLSVPDTTVKMTLGNVQLEPIDLIFSKISRRHLASPLKISNDTKSFESLNQFSGFVLFETYLPAVTRNPVVLSINGLRDRAQIFINYEYQGILTRDDKQPTYLPIKVAVGDLLQILVENQGRMNYGDLMDFKGILGNVTVGQETLHNWNITGYPFDDYNKIRTLIDHRANCNYMEECSNGLEFLKHGPMLFHGNFFIENLEIFDTYLNPFGWTKGVAFVNGFNLGRYWPAVGPQINLYVPKELLRHGLNEVVLLELQQAPLNRTISFVGKPNLIGYKFAANKTMGVESAMAMVADK